MEALHKLPYPTAVAVLIQQLLVKVHWAVGLVVGLGMLVWTTLEFRWACGLEGSHFGAVLYDTLSLTCSSAIAMRSWAQELFLTLLGQVLLRWAEGWFSPKKKH